MLEERWNPPPSPRRHGWIDDNRASRDGDGAGQSRFRQACVHRHAIRGRRLSAGARSACTPWTPRPPRSRIVPAAPLPTVLLGRTPPRTAVGSQQTQPESGSWSSAVGDGFNRKPARSPGRLTTDALDNRQFHPKEGDHLIACSHSSSAASRDPIVGSGPSGVRDNPHPVRTSFPVSRTSECRRRRENRTYRGEVNATTSGEPPDNQPHLIFGRPAGRRFPVDGRT